jgi:hypothetical protein
MICVWISVMQGFLPSTAARLPEAAADAVDANDAEILAMEAVLADQCFAQELTDGPADPTSAELVCGRTSLWFFILL